MLCGFSEEGENVDIMFYPECAEDDVFIQEAVRKGLPIGVLLSPGSNLQNGIMQAKLRAEKGAIEPVVMRQNPLT